MNGIEDMIYMSSSSDNTGQYELTVTFEVGTDLEIAQVRVQNRVQQALPRLPMEVTQQGLSVDTRSSSMLGVVFFRSPNKTYDEMFACNYVHTYIKDVLKRIPGVGGVDVFGPEYSMRVWLNSDRMAGLGLSSDDVVSAIQQQNLQASVGSIGSAPQDDGPMVMVFPLQAKGRLNEIGDFENIVVRSNDEGGLVRLKDIGRIEMGGNTYTHFALMNGAPGGGLRLSQTPGTNALDAMDAVYAKLE